MTIVMDAVFPAMLNHLWITVAAAFVLVLVGSTTRVSAPWLTIIAAISSAAAGVIGFIGFETRVESHLLWSGAVVVDASSIASSVTCALAVAAVLAVSVNSKHISQSAERHWPGLVLLTSSALMMVVHANHLATLLVATESAALGLVAVVGLGRAQARGSEAATKAVVVGAVAFGLSGFGMALIFGGSGGVLDYVSLEKSFASQGPSAVATLGALFVVVAFLFRLGAAPFHMAAPDLIDGAPLPSAMFSVSAFRLCFVLGMLRMLKLGFLAFSANGDMTGLSQVFGWVAALSMLVGAIGAVRQESLKRTLAYLSISQLGFALLAIVALSQNTAMAATAIGACLLGQVVAFSVAFAALNQISSSAESHPFVDDLAGLAQARPLLAFSFAVALLSVESMPFTMGFPGFFSALLSAFSTPLMLPLGCVGLAAFLIGLYPPIRAIVAMYFRHSAKIWPANNPSGGAAVLSVGSFILLLFGIVTSPWLSWARLLVP
jgi:NADH-quinone oxidoreductase subunit N